MTSPPRHGWYHRHRVDRRPVGAEIEKPVSLLVRGDPIVLANGSDPLGMSGPPERISEPPRGRAVALDTVYTPFGHATEALGGSAVFFACAASSYPQVQVVGVVGIGLPLQAARSAGGQGNRPFGRGEGERRKLPLEREVLLRPAEPRYAGDSSRSLRQLPAPHPRQLSATPNGSFSATSIPSSSSVF